MFILENVQALMELKGRHESHYYVDDMTCCFKFMRART